MNVIFSSLVLISTTTLYATQNCHARSTSTTQVYTSEPTVPTIPEFNCDPDKLFMCDRLKRVQLKMELVGLCQEQLELAGETAQAIKQRGMDQLLGLLFSRVAVPCSRNDWSAGSRRLGEAVKELKTIVALVTPFADSGTLRGATLFGFRFADSFPFKVMLEQIDCLENQDKYFTDYSLYLSSL